MGVAASIVTLKITRRYFWGSRLFAVRRLPGLRPGNAGRLPARAEFADEGARFGGKRSRTGELDRQVRSFLVLEVGYRRNRIRPWRCLGRFEEARVRS